MNIDFIYCNRLNQFVVTAETASKKAYVYTVNELVVTVWIKEYIINIRNCNLSHFP